MTNHSEIPRDNPILRELMRRVEREPLKGATGDFPEGKMTPHDEGGIQFQVGAQKGKIVIDFGTPVVWVGMPPETAVQLAESLIRHARTMTKQQGKRLSVSI